MKNNLPYNLNFTDQGQGTPVILLHGVAGSLRQWDYLIPPLLDAGYRTLAVDLLGHGDSSWTTDPRHINQHGGYQIEPVYEYFKFWLEGLELATPPIIIAHSMGGYLALNHVLRGNPVKGLLLVSPYYTPKQLSRTVRLSIQRPAISSVLLQNTPYQWVESVIRLSHRNGMSGLFNEAQRQMAVDFKRFDPRILALPHSTEDLTPHLPRIRVPTTVVWGEKDLTLSPGSFPRLAISIPHARSVRIPQCGHVPHLSHLDFFNQTALQFIRDLSQGYPLIPTRKPFADYPSREA
ncbi:MAG: alpha/beta hydrolase [Anaerolineales bacterium]|nr:alpha/beta hydrolase [Anaerolineales bacterium]